MSPMPKTKAFERSDGKKIQELPLKSMDYSGSVEGSLANLELKLSYQNKLTRPLEPVFTFPLPAEATVLGVTVKAGDKIIQSELKKAAEARQDYEQAVSAGHQAALLEQHRDNIFTMSVGGIEPGENIEVSVKYLHPVDWQNGGGRFILPLVVAPHFIHGNPLERRQGPGFAPDTDQVPDASKITPHVAADPDEITYRASVKIALNPGFEAKVACPSHDALLEERTLAQGEKMVVALSDLRPDRDLTLTYQGQSRSAEVKHDKTSWQSADGKGEEFNLLQLMPGGAVPLRPRQVVLCLDCSGSMNGLPIAGLRAVVERAVGQLRASGEPVELGVVKFNDHPEVLLPLQKLTPNLDLKRLLSQLEAGGGTRAGIALDQAIGLFGADRPAGAERSIVFVTDGDTSDIRHGKYRPADIRIHAVGLSTAVDHAVLKEVSRSSGGSTYWVYPGEDYDTAAREIVARTSGPLLRNVRLNGLPAGSEVVGIQDIYLGHPHTIAIRSPGEASKLSLSAESADGSPVNLELDASGAGKVSFGHTMWTKMRIRDERDDNLVTDLSLKYGVLARTTSYVAVLLRERPGAKPERIEIPVSLPHGWEMEQGWALNQPMAPGSARMCAMSKGRARLSLGRSSMGGGGLFSAGIDIGCIESIDSCGIDSDDPADGPVHAYPELLTKVTLLLTNLKLGQVEEVEARKHWTVIQQEMGNEAGGGFANWDATQKAELYRALSELRGYGYKLPIPLELRTRPQDRAAFHIWRQAERSLGVEHSR